ncbi:MAG: hypothetical protein ACYC3I_16055 [Gemmataceae bacterium]
MNIENPGPGLVIFPLVGHQVVEANTAVLADGSARDFAFVHQLDQVGARDVEQIGGLLRGHLGMGGNEGHGVALGHFDLEMQEQAQCGRWHRYRFGLLAIVEELDADAGPLAELMGRQLDSRASRASASVGTTVSKLSEIWVFMDFCLLFRDIQGAAFVKFYIKKT